MAELTEKTEKIIKRVYFNPVSGVGSDRGTYVQAKTYKPRN